ncbi:hypothetical protein [Rhizobium sp. Leaf386]|uniref:hypothetical protein n=1 Tax=Rhizobium sp. Leaf386 TaxID=1736359 RepID=UPI000715E662|nr:hypothetical protein [Rhizobium sp. Leaf386]KQS95369.1 hypothetical protein ASG50_25425 [Rhizobium sp. Leaf386]
MLSISNLRTSQLEDLAERIPKGECVDELVDATRRFLSNISLDGGADSDLVFMSGKRLAAVGVWNSIAPPKLAKALKGVPRETVELFLERAAAGYKYAVLDAMAVPEQQKGKAIKGKRARKWVIAAKKHTRQGSFVWSQRLMDHTHVFDAAIGEFVPAIDRPTMTALPNRGGASGKVVVKRNPITGRFSKVINEYGESGGKVSPRHGVGYRAGQHPLQYQKKG